MHSSAASMSFQAPTCLCAHPCPGPMWRTPRTLHCRPPLHRCPRCQCIQSSHCRPTVAVPLSPAVMRLSLINVECSSRPSSILQASLHAIGPWQLRGISGDTTFCKSCDMQKSLSQGFMSCCIEDAHLSQIVITARWRRCKDHIGEGVTHSSALCPRPDTQAP